nr:hypothetical protein [Tanacetum cinerariifolium]
MLLSTISSLPLSLSLSILTRDMALTYLVMSLLTSSLINTFSGDFPFDNPHKTLKEKSIVDSGYSRHMTRNKAYLVDYHDFNGGPVAFGGSKGQITGKDTECLVLSPDFKLPDENQVLLRVPRQHSMHSFNLENIVPSGGLACLIAKATVVKSTKWHRRTKWVYRNKRDKKGVVVRNKARLVAHGHRQEEGIDYDEVFAPVAMNEAIRIFLDFASYMGFIAHQMDVKSAFLYGKIDGGSMVCYFIYFSGANGYRRGLIDKTLFIKKEKKDIMLMSSMGELTFFLGLQVNQKEDGIFISQDKYVAEILKKFDFLSVKTASTPIETKKPLVKDEEAADVDVHLYRSMIGSLMYLTSSWLDIMYAVCTCSRFQVTLKTLHLQAVKRIFRYLKGQPKLGLWYPSDSPFDLEAYSDISYAKANLDRKSTTGGCQFLGRRLISWQCKKQTIVATSTTEAEYVAAASYCGQVLWIQN